MKIKLLLVAALLQLTASPLSAQVLLSTAYHARYEQGVGDRDLRNSSGKIFSVGYGRERFALLLEWFSYEQIDRSGQMSTRLDHSEWLLWLRYRLSATDRLSPFVAIGGGVYERKVDVGFRQARATGASELEGILSAGAGVEYRIFDNLMVDLEGRSAVIADEKEAAYSWLARLTFAL